MTWLRCLVAAAWLVLPTVSAWAAAENEPEVEQMESGEEEEGGRLYTTQSERREAGLGHPVTPWLTASFLLELESAVEYRDYRGEKPSRRDSEFATNFQLGLVATPWETVTAEWVVEFDSEEGRLFTDEAFVSLETGDFEWELGEMYTPFGNFVSHFASGPILEFGETRAPMLGLSYAPSDGLDLKAAAYQGDARRTDTDPNQWDYVLALESWASEQLTFGLSWQSDLADADSQLLEDENNRYRRRVPAASGYLIWSGETLEVSLEALGALRRFAELDPDRNKPLAWNLELTRFVDAGFEWSLRLEGSRELEDEPRFQAGVSLTWRLSGDAALTAEYLRGWYQEGLAVDDEDEPFGHIDRLAAQLSVLF